MKQPMPSSKTLILLRHAKSSWQTEGIDDFDRPLAPRGKRAATLIGQYLAAGREEEHSLTPDHVLCSPAQRTKATWQLVEHEISSGAAVEMPEILYAAGSHALLSETKQIDEAVTTLAIIGHLPGIDGLALNLTGNRDHEGWHRMRRKFPTAGLAVIRLTILKWDQLVDGCGVLDRFITPKDLERGDYTG